MSATNRGAKRVESDYYPTPKSAVHSLLAEVPLPGGRWLECCAGNGHIIDAVEEVRSDVSFTAVELREECRPVLECYSEHVNIMSFLDYQPVFGKFDVIITNPPFGMAEEIIRHALPMSDWVVMLLRLNFYGSQARADWLRSNTPDAYVLPNRPKFGKNKHGKMATDATEYGWLIWGPSRNKNYGRIQVLSAQPRERKT